MIEFFLSPVGILILLNTVVFFLPNIVSFSKGGLTSSERFIALGWKDNDDIKSGEYYRLITAMFLHADVLHLVSNMWALFVLGSSLSLQLPIVFIGIYFISGIIGNLFSYFFNKSPSVGASGAIFGLVGFILVQSFVSGAFSSSASLILYIILSFVLAMLPHSKIDIYGHLGGLLGGVLLSFLILFI